MQSISPYIILVAYSIESVIRLGYYSSGSSHILYSYDYSLKYYCKTSFDVPKISPIKDPIIHPYARESNESMAMRSSKSL